jgi:outer membrane immunogenic protein
MKKVILVATVVAATLFGSSAFAQANKFEGFSAGLNLNMVKTGFEVNASGATVGTSANDTVASLQAQYTIALNEKYTLGLGANIGLSSVKAGSITTTELKGKNFNSFYVAPGYAISDSTLLFGKLGSVSGTGESSSAGSSTSESFTGIYFGAGIQSYVDKNLYLQFEYGQTSFSEKSVTGGTYRPTQSGFLIGAGYKF